MKYNCPIVLKKLKSPNIEYALEFIMPYVKMYWGREFVKKFGKNVKDDRLKIAKAYIAVGGRSTFTRKTANINWKKSNIGAHTLFKVQKEKISNIILIHIMKVK